MENEENKRRNLLEEKRKVEISSLRRLLNHHDEFFNFINLNDVWYRWVTGKYAVTSIDSMGETLIQYIGHFCLDNQVNTSRNMCSHRLLVINYKGVYFLLRKMDGKDEFAAISSVEYAHNFTVISWDKLYSYIELKLRCLLYEKIEEIEEAESLEPLQNITLIKE